MTDRQHVDQKAMKRMDSADTPARQGYRWPAEWEPHAATWLAWPHNRDTWPGHYEPVPAAFTQLVQAIARFEPVHVLAGGPAREPGRYYLGALDHVTLHDVPTNDAWARDYGPVFLVHADRQALACVDWQFNAWGGKYPPWDLDDAVPRHVSAHLGIERFEPHMVLEGGSIDGNGQGLLMTTESCLLDPHRNACASRAVMEARLRDFACATEVLWLAGGPLAGDDTDGHIDQLARFVGTRTVVVAVTEDAAEPQQAALRANRAQLEAYRDGDGQPLRVIPLPLPRPIRYDGQSTPASYCNFYVVNGGLIMPEFEDPADARARAILARAFPDRQVVGVPARALIWGLGAVHCLTQQQPAVTAR